MRRYQVESRTFEVEQTPPRDWTPAGTFTNLNSAVQAARNRVDDLMNACPEKVIETRVSALPSGPVYVRCDVCGAYKREDKVIDGCCDACLVEEELS